MKVYICFPEGKMKALTMSYDDGKVQDEKLIEIFDQYGIKGTFNLNYGLMENKQSGRPCIRREQVKELYRNHEVATHSLTHPMLENCPLEEAAEEILEDRKGLEALTGKLVRGHAYPYGSYTEEIKNLYRLLGIAYARVTGASNDFKLPADPLEWHPTCHHRDPELMKKAEYFVNFRMPQYRKLMYVWGHSYEFDDNDNWEIIEEFCRYIGGREDIWYATNLEIIDYMAAADNLKFSADHKMVYNPGAGSVWLQLDHQEYLEVKSGQTITL